MSIRRVVRKRDPVATGMSPVAASGGLVLLEPVETSSDRVLGWYIGMHDANDGQDKLAHVDNDNLWTFVPKPAGVVTHGTVTVDCMVVAIGSTLWRSTAIPPTAVGDWSQVHAAGSSIVGVESALGRMVATTSGGEVLRSEDGGQTWVVAYSAGYALGPPQRTIDGAWSAHGPTIEDSLVSYNDGYTWEVWAEGAGQTDAVDSHIRLVMSYSPYEYDWWFFSTSAGVKFTVDDGATWNTHPTGAFPGLAHDRFYDRAQAVDYNTAAQRFILHNNGTAFQTWRAITAQPSAAIDTSDSADYRGVSTYVFEKRNDVRFNVRTIFAMPQDFVWSDNGTNGQSWTPIEFTGTEPGRFTLQRPFAWDGLMPQIPAAGSTFFEVPPSLCAITTRETAAPLDEGLVTVTKVRGVDVPLPMGYFYNSPGIWSFKGVTFAAGRQRLTNAPLALRYVYDGSAWLEFKPWFYTAEPDPNDAAVVQGTPARFSDDEYMLTLRGNSDAYLLRTVDGVNWPSSIITKPIGAEGGTALTLWPNVIEWIGDQWVMYCSSFDSTTPSGRSHALSPDGITWTMHTVPVAVLAGYSGAPTTIPPLNVRASAGGWIGGLTTVTVNGTNNIYDVLMSNDNSNWTRYTAAADFPITDGLGGLVELTELGGDVFAFRSGDTSTTFWRWTGSGWAQAAVLPFVPTPSTARLAVRDGQDTALFENKLDYRFHSLVNANGVPVLTVHGRNLGIQSIGSVAP